MNCNPACGMTGIFGAEINKGESVKIYRRETDSVCETNIVCVCERHTVALPRVHVRNINTAILTIFIPI